MKPSTVLIVDDESPARARIRSLLKHRTDLKLFEAENGLKALEILKGQPIDILLLDIQMPEVSGMELLAQLEARPFQVIFQTAFDEYAIQAFEANACDYLLKPFPQERLEKALARASERLGNNASLAKTEARLRQRDGYLEKICARVGTKILLVPTEEIFAFVSQDHCTTVFADNKEYVIELSLTHLEERLDPKKFQRLHRNNIVALEKIQSVHGGDNMEVELRGGRRLPVSRNNRKKLAF